MNIVVMGGGVIGVTCAYYLARDGHQVTVIERQDECGRETSFANAGLVAPGHATTWASPGAPLTLLKSLLHDDMSLRFKFSADPRFWIWGLRFLLNCTAARSRENTLPKLRLCLYSQAETKALLAETGIDCDMLSRGILYLYRHAENLEAGITNMAFLKDHGHVQEVIDVDRVVELEPALAAQRHLLAGAILGPNDESGDSFKFTTGLAAYCADTLGVDFRYGTNILALTTDGGKITGVVSDKGPITGDAYVMCLASESPAILRSAGMDAPIYPIKGYSMTYPVGDAEGAPTMGGIDEEALIAWSRLGDHVRFTATAEFSGYDTSFKPSDFIHMTRVARELFPESGDFDQATHWACLRPMTADGPPIMGRGRLDNLWLNTGQGHMGWTMACGSGRVVADLIQGRAPAIDIRRMEVR
ncbi:MAG: D-amino acid dehydrogenase [Alphaproteobacteria bacterium]|jgi:D-amino-acid dehydrogenase